MKFRNLILKNIFRNKSRSLLAIIGIAIGVAAVVGLGMVTDNLSKSTETALTAGAGDFSVIAATGQNNGGGPPGGMGQDQVINQTKVDEISKITGVESAVGVLRTSVDLSNSTNTTTNSTSGPGNFRSMTSIIGINSASISMDDIVITNGTVYSNNDEVVIGKTAAQEMNKTVGDNITISNKTFEITGIYETGNFMDDRGIVMSLDSLQSLTNQTGEVSLIIVKANNGTDATSLASKIQNNYPNELTTSTSLSGMDRMNNGLDVIKSGSWAVSLLAMLVGGIIVVITMLKAVSERTREIGVLRAVGWKQKRIIAMIMGESLIISFIAIFVGLIIGFGIVELLSVTNVLRGIMPVFSIYLFLKAIGVALLLGILGGIYPAYRASRLSPTEALRYE